MLQGSPASFELALGNKGGRNFPGVAQHQNFYTSSVLSLEDEVSLAGPLVWSPNSAFNGQLMEPCKTTAVHLGGVTELMTTWRATRLRRLQCNSSHGFQPLECEWCRYYFALVPIPTW